MSVFDIDAALRWARLDPRKPLSRREDADLPFINEVEIAGQPLLLDTCVYIDQMQGRSPALIERLVQTRRIGHSTVAQQELLHTIGVLKPDDPRTPGVISNFKARIVAMPEHRIYTPDADVLGRAAIIAGMLCRLQGYKDDRRFKALQDATLFLQAQKLGFTVLTANIIEFDYLLQLVPSGRVLFYRKST